VARVVTYQLDPETTVQFEIEPPQGPYDFEPAGPDQIVGQVRAAVEPAVRAAQVVLEKAKQMAPKTVEVKFGIKVSGTANWIVAKTATEGNFEVTLTWEPGPPAGRTENGQARAGEVEVGAAS